MGYEISFTRHFYRPAPMRTLDEIKSDIYALEHETEGLLDDILIGGVITSYSIHYTKLYEAKKPLQTTTCKRHERRRHA